MQDFEKLGVFYLGRHYDLREKKSLPKFLLYESKDLLTHALVVGMTGSGKTGLCFDIIEEAAIDGIPAIVIDPKGDLGNLMLTFPDLRPEDFGPWVNEDDARKLGISVEEYATRQAELWRKGLASWGQDGERIRRLRDAAEVAIYTPGSSAGLPVSILKSFSVPPADVMSEPELLRERIASTVAGLLGLVGVQADPVRSRETILLSNVLQQAWTSGRDLDLLGLIHEIQQPSITRVGALDLETFYPAKERFELAMALNNLLASPSFASWLEGEPLNVKKLLYTAAGKPRVAIVSIAHLSDSERMFFVTLLLNEVLAWMRTQTGTNSLRALVYMDEIFGYFPPVANPPSKLPLLTLLKQARAFGTGIVLATQNPVDLDYKGLANIGTWLIGRLQTDRDKARVLDGLEGAAAGRNTSFDRPAMEQTLAGLGNRVFLLHNVHEDGFDIFESRWAMSYLRGPLSREQIKKLANQRPTPAPADAPAETTTISAPAIAGDASRTRPVLPPQVPQFFVPVLPPLAGDRIVYQPRLLGAAQVRFANPKHKLDVSQDILVITEIADTPVPVDWSAAEDLAIRANELEKNPTHGEYSVCAPAASQVRNYETWAKDFSNWIFSKRKLTLHSCLALELTSRAGETEADFRIRLQQAAREQRDAEAEKLRRKYAPKITVLNERLRRTQAAGERESAQAKRAKLDTVISLGSTLLGAFLGRKTFSAGTIGKAATTMRGATRAMDQAGDVARAEETVQAVQRQIADLDAQFAAESEALAGSLERAASELETLELSPTKANIQVRLVALVWLPFSRDAVGMLKPAYRTTAA